MSTALANRGEHHDLPSVQAATSITEAMSSLKALRTFIDQEFVEGTDYGKIPGCGDKPTLFLPGAQKASMYFNVRPKYIPERIDLGGGHVEFIITTRLISRSSKEIMGEGLGSCSTMESKYRYRKAEKVCPKCGKNAIIRGRQEYGGGWVCYDKKGGCKSKFADDAPSIISQPEGLVENPDLYDVHNTVLKMGKKRSHVDAAMTLGCLSEFFTQDMVDRQDTYGFMDVQEAARQEYAGDYHVNGEVIEPQGPAVPHTDNGSGNGKTKTFASAEQTTAFNAWISGYCKKLNQRWQEIWADRMADGKPIPVDLKDYLHVNQAKNHLMKWCVDAELLDPAIIPEGVAMGQKDRLLAVPYHRSEADRQRLKAELADYAGKQKTLKETAIFLKNPDMAPDGWLQEYQESIAPNPEDEGQEDDYVAPEPAKKRPTKLELANTVKARAEADKQAKALAIADRGDAYEEPER